MENQIFNPAIHKQESHLECVESSECGNIEGRFGIGLTQHNMRCVISMLQHTSKVKIHLSVLILNLQKWLSLLLRPFFISWSLHHTFSKKVSGCRGSKNSLAHMSVTRFSVFERLIILWV